jgi:type I restriction enzyme S subunit
VHDTIEATQVVIEQLRVIKKALLSEVVTRGVPGRHTRFKRSPFGEVPEEWRVHRLGDILERNRRPVAVEEAAVYREIGIRSHGKGLFNKEPVLGRDLGNKRIF